VNGTFECSGPPCPSGPPACPYFQPYSDTACPWPTQECGYTSDQNPCGAVDCYCASDGLWSCDPACVAVDAGVAPGVDAAGE
jgi:hypothetical protein